MTLTQNWMATRMPFNIVPNVPCTTGLNNVAVVGSETAIALAAIVADRTRLQVTAIWTFHGNEWRFWLPGPAGVSSTLTDFPGPTANAFVVLQ